MQETERIYIYFNNDANLHKYNIYFILFLNLNFKIYNINIQADLLLFNCNSREVQVYFPVVIK